MTSLQRRQEILQEINAITRMERGKLCTQSPGPGARPFHKLQFWHHGKNQTRYVPAHEVAALQEALAGHQRFQELAEEFVELTVALTRAELASDAKKNSRKSRANVTAKPKRS
jgi:hypothetical protein